MHMDTLVFTFSLSPFFFFLFLCRLNFRGINESGSFCFLFVFRGFFSWSFLFSFSFSFSFPAIYLIGERRKDGGICVFFFAYIYPELLGAFLVSSYVTFKLLPPCYASLVSMCIV